MLSGNGRSLPCSLSPRLVSTPTGPPTAAMSLLVVITGLAALRNDVRLPEWKRVYADDIAVVHTQQ